MTALGITLLLLGVGLVLAGLAGLLLPAIPGAPLMFVGLVLVAWAEDFQYVGVTTLAVLAGLALLTYLVDLAAGILGARHFGASGRAMIGAGIGALLGLFFGLPGIILGPFIGACVGELTAVADLKAASRAGVGATVGLVLGAALKIAIAFTMLGIFVFMRLA
ncbi:MAG: DUF456 domain-containing protein [Gammaproteobacteria bacterium]|nr:DUF456 domain-containing protein [Gammaproteobacteria bacterium]